MTMTKKQIQVYITGEEAQNSNLYQILKNNNVNIDILNPGGLDNLSEVGGSICFFNISMIGIITEKHLGMFGLNILTGQTAEIANEKKIDLFDDYYLCDEPESIQEQRINLILVKMKSAEKKRKEKEEKEKLEERIKLLIQSAKIVLEESSFEKTAKQIFDFCRNLTGAKSGYVALLNSDGSENEVLFLEAGGMPCTVDPELPMPIRGLRSVAYETGKATYHNDFMNSEWVDFMLAGHVNMKNVMFAPLNIDIKTVGIVGLANKDGDFTEEEAEIVSIFAEYISIALKNSQSRSALEEREKMLDLIFDNSPGIIFVKDRKGRYLKVNKIFHKKFGTTETGVIDQSNIDIFAFEEAELLDANDRRAFEMAGRHRSEEDIYCGGIKRTFLSMREMMDTDFNPEKLLIGIMTDITDQKNNEMDLKKIITEKEFLLREVNHRVKNNFQIVSSLLAIESGNSSNKEAAEILRTSRNRIQRMANIHEILYKSEDFENINFAQHLRKLTSDICRSYSEEGKRIEVNIDSKKFVLDIRRGVTCSLIINELMTNSIKHAFTGRNEGRIDISLKMDNNQYKMIFSDDGKGYKGDIFSDNKESLGLKLLRIMVEDQLSGILKISGSQGMRFDIIFSR